MATYYHKNPENDGVTEPLFISGSSGGVFVPNDSIPTDFDDTIGKVLDQQVIFFDVAAEQVQFSESIDEPAGFSDDIDQPVQFTETIDEQVTATENIDEKTEF